MRGHPEVVVNQYYNPFGSDLRCLGHVGLTSDKVEVLVQRLDALNAVLSKGAKASGFRSVQPDVSGHQLCSAPPYVQGLGAVPPDGERRARDRVRRRRCAGALTRQVIAGRKKCSVARIARRPCGPLGCRR